MANVKEAVQKATTYFVDLMGEKITDVWLEEVEPSLNGQLWLVTLSALAPSRRKNLIELKAPLAEMFGGSQAERIYRVFSVDADTNEVKSMKIRKPE